MVQFDSTNGINYRALQLGKSEQIGGSTDARNQVSGSDYTNGLSLAEMEEIDKTYGNKDGFLTESEFTSAMVAKYGSTANTGSLWGQYVSGFSSMLQKRGMTISYGQHHQQHKWENLPLHIPRAVQM